jgi:GNAT superfamily N-acetyltransferase
MQIDVIHGFLSRSYWSPGIRRDLVEKAIANSLVLGVFEDATGAQVAFARVITDQATFAYLCDVFVVEGHRGRGLSKEMMAALLADERLSTVRHWVLLTRDAHSLYAGFGFEPGDPGRMMRLARPKESWQDPRLLNPEG